MSAVIITIAALDLLDVLRVISVLVEKLFLEMIFRHVFCSMGVFHELAVAVLIVTASIAVCFQVCGQCTLNRRRYVPAFAFQ